MYKTVIFDLGKVVVNFDFGRGYTALEGLCPHNVAEIRKRIGASGLVPQFETGLVEPHDFVDQFSKILSLDMDYDRFAAVWSCIFLETLIPEAMIEGLARRYRLLLLSNTNAIHFEMIRENYPIIRHFHQLILSYEVKAMKPDPAIYQAALAAAQCKPEECFYTDDIAEYVEGARKMGIDAVQFVSLAQLQGDLRTRGIRWDD